MQLTQRSSGATVPIAGVNPPAGISTPHSQEATKTPLSMSVFFCGRQQPFVAGCSGGLRARRILDAVVLTRSIRLPNEISTSLMAVKPSVKEALMPNHTQATPKNHPSNSINTPKSSCSPDRARMASEMMESIRGLNDAQWQRFSIYLRVISAGGSIDDVEHVASQGAS